MFVGTVAGVVVVAGVVAVAVAAVVGVGFVGDGPVGCAGDVGFVGVGVDADVNTFAAMSLGRDVMEWVARGARLGPRSEMMSMQFEEQDSTWMSVVRREHVPWHYEMG